MWRWTLIPRAPTPSRPYTACAGSRNEAVGIGETIPQVFSEPWRDVLAFRTVNRGMVFRMVLGSNFFSSSSVPQR